MKKKLDKETITKNRQIRSNGLYFEFYSKNEQMYFASKTMKFLNKKYPVR